MRATVQNAVSVIGIAAMIGGTGCKRSSASPEQAQQGRDLFAATCAKCHGSDGKGGLPLYEGGPSPRNFCDHDFHRERTDEQIRMTIVNGKGPGMPPFGTTFDPAQLEALVAHVRSYDSEKTK